MADDRRPTPRTWPRPLTGAWRYELALARSYVFRDVGGGGVVVYGAASAQTAVEWAAGRARISDFSCRRPADNCLLRHSLYCAEAPRARSRRTFAGKRSSPGHDEVATMNWAALYL